MHQVNEPEGASNQSDLSDPAGLKVLQVIDTLGMGGAETWLMELLRRWNRTGEASMDFLITSGRPGLFDTEARALGARIIYAHYGRSHLQTFIPVFQRVLRVERYAAIHDHQDYTSGWHYLMGGNALPPVRITHVHNPSYQIRNNYGVTPGRRITAWVGRRLVAARATHIAGTSRQVLSEYGFDSRQFRHLPRFPLHCGFSTDRFAGDVVEAKASICREFGWPGDSRIVLFAGRMDESAEMGHPRNHKNSGFAVSVVLDAFRRDRRVRALFAGNQSAALPDLEARVEAAGASGAIRFIGIRRDIERLMLGSDSLLFPSRGEGLGMAAVEAQAAGLPVLASRDVPKECVVVDDLVRFLDVAEGGTIWAEELLKLAYRPRENLLANMQVARSPFAIANSSSALLKIYAAGTAE